MYLKGIEPYYSGVCGKHLVLNKKRFINFHANGETLPSSVEGNPVLSLIYVRKVYRLSVEIQSRAEDELPFEVVPSLLKNKEMKI